MCKAWILEKVTGFLDARLDGLLAMRRSMVSSRRIAADEAHGRLAAHVVGPLSVCEVLNDCAVSSLARG
jgi:hypothetical protein